MRSLRSIFAGIDPGESCTATIRFFRLSARKLLDDGIIVEHYGDYLRSHKAIGRAAEQ